MTSADTSNREDGPLTERIIAPMSKAMVDAIADYRFGNRLESKSEAVRRLIAAGLRAEGIAFDAGQDGK
ncbi:hypothetical protein [Filomicrobium sp.]|uniref:hypothetical protein n=1 Tax=Filomicrobium sp. TaxID=2024831 RepID=UPI00259120BF|nr:hypothetical protein [Filomicrobium sp.]MCV0371743.1 hypothetical protein [Filomicrobium sp.]